MHFNTQNRLSRDRWIPHVVQSHFMEISYLAWSGYQHHGKGMVLGEVCVEKDPTTANSCHLSYLSRQKAIAHFKHLEFFSSDLAHLAQAIEEYEPHAEIILMLTGNGEQLVTRLENLKILPEDAFNQVCARWQEYSITLGNPLKGLNLPGAIDSTPLGSVEVPQFPPDLIQINSGDFCA
ncbi:MAG: hypothetical protein HC810_03795 [Acaryochloridaceae cyanobacterium RL_2_7]|nr:hypothetical protein [Acaryochloridaceae cyanobacterium RL_2_7]